MLRLYIAAGVLAALLGLGYYAKEATERAVLAEAALNTLARGYEQYEERIAEANAAQKRRDAEWRRLEENYEEQIQEFNSRPVTQCDVAAVDSAITDSLLSGAGYSEAGGADTGDATAGGGAPGPAPYLSNRGQSDWLAGYQQRLNACNAQLGEIARLVREANAAETE